MPSPMSVPPPPERSTCCARLTRRTACTAASTARTRTCRVAQPGAGQDGFDLGQRTGEQPFVHRTGGVADDRDLRDRALQRRQHDVWLEVRAA